MSHPSAMDDVANTNNSTSSSSSSSSSVFASSSQTAPQAAAASSSSSSSSSTIPRNTISMDERDEMGDFLGADEAVEVIQADENDPNQPADDGDEMDGDDDAVMQDDSELTPEERAQRDADNAKTTAMATEIRQMLDQDDSSQGFFAHNDSVFAVALSRHIPGLALSGDGNDQAYLWDITTGEQKRHLTGHTDSVIDGNFSCDGRYVATASMDATVRVYNVADGSLKHSLEGPAKELEWMQWHPAGPVIVAGSADETVWMWNAESGECMGVFSGHSGSVTCGGWTLDGKQLITCGESGDLIVWTPKTGEKAIHLKDLHDGAITSFAIHPDKTIKMCMTGGHDGEVKVISYETGKTLAHYKQIHTDSVEGVQFAMKHKLAATCSVDGKIKILDLTNGQVRVTCAHEDAVTHVEWSPNGEPLLFSSSVDKTIKLWDARSGQCVQTWKGHSDAVLTFTVSEDAGTIVTGSDDHTSLVFKR